MKDHSAEAVEATMVAALATANGKWHDLYIGFEYVAPDTSFVHDGSRMGIVCEMCHGAGPNPRWYAYTESDGIMVHHLPNGEKFQCSLADAQKKLVQLMSQVESR